MTLLPLITSGWLAIATSALCADAATPAENLAHHQQGATKVADDQDELSADVQQLAIEQTLPKVIELLHEVEATMDEATDRLAKADTGGETLAAQTEIIEKIIAAAKQKQSQGGNCPSGSAMMDMLERMGGHKPEGNSKGQGQGKDGQAGDQGGQGTTGLSDTTNDATGGQPGGKSEARRVPKAAGATSHEIPGEFKQAFDAYNRGAEQKVK